MKIFFKILSRWDHKKIPGTIFANSTSIPSKSRFEGAKFNLYSSTSIFLSEPMCQNKNIYMDFGNHTGNRQWMMSCSCLFIFLLVLSDRVRNLKGKSVISWAVRARIFCWTFKTWKLEKLQLRNITFIATRKVFWKQEYVIVALNQILHQTC